MFAITAIGVPSGVIVEWRGSFATIPSGYVICNGSNGTPDLRDKFVIAANRDDAGVAKTLVTGSLTQSGGNIAHTHAIGTGDSYGEDGETASNVDISGSTSHLPPYYALVYIMKT